MADEQPRRRGRPRDPSIDTRVVTAARDLLAERGFDATTIQAIAERSGVHPSAIYRRWESRTDIIEEAVFPGSVAVAADATGDLRRDLRRLIRSLVAHFATPAARAAMPGLLASYQSSGRSGAPETWLPVSVRPRFVEILRRSGVTAAGCAVDPEDVFDMVIGAVVARTLIPTIAERNRPVERLVELTVRMLEPGPGASGDHAGGP